jgi:hypothetical protein
MKDETIISGTRASDGRALAWIDGDTPLPHVVHHSPTGFEWGYGGSGPADLALSILSFVIGPEQETVGIYEGKRCGALAWEIHQSFKRDFVSGWGGEWAITVGQVRDWIAAQRQPCELCEGECTEACPECSGSGDNGEGRPCPKCGGDGRVPCAACGGKGYYWQ